MKGMRRVVLVFALFLSFHSVLEAKVTCTGDACAILPTNILTQINNVDQVLQVQYTDKVLQSMTEAAIITNINSSLMGPGIVNRFQVGTGLTLAGQKKADIDILYGDLNFRKLPNVGAAISPNFVVAVNLGWLLGDGPSDTEPDLKSFMHRFNLYLHGFSFNFGDGDVQRIVEQQLSNTKLAGDITNGGFTLRYHLVENYSDGYGFFEFAGVSLGLGLHYQKQAINLTYSDSSTQAITLGPAKGTWGGESTFNYNSTITSVPLDLRTGVRMFYFLTFFAGAGTSLNFGTTDLVIQRSGPLTISLDSGAISTSIPANLQALIPSSLLNQSRTGTLGLDVSGKALAPNSLGFLVAGFEFNALITKITLEAMVSQQVQSVMAGFKIAF